MSDAVLRPIRPDDAFALYEVFRRSLAGLLERINDPWPYDPTRPDEAAYWDARWRPMFEHLGAACDLAWVAESDGDAVGYARSMRRGDTRELTEFFVLPEAAGRGLGRLLLEAALPDGEAAHRMIIATPDVSAQARYLRAGFRTHGVVADLRGSPDPTPVPTDLVARPIDVADPRDLDALAELDTRLLHGRRDADQRWFAAHRTGRLFLRDGRPAGYGWAGWWAGPVAALDAHDLPAMLAMLEEVAAQDGREEIGWQVPQTAQPAVQHLLSRGYRLDPFPTFLMSDGPDLPGRFDRYLLTSPPFFV
jgi:GNAT superfamily N-acetyltransferase